MWQVTTPQEGCSYKNQVEFVDVPDLPWLPLKKVTGVMWVPLGSTPPGTARGPIDPELSLAPEHPKYTYPLIRTARGVPQQAEHRDLICISPSVLPSWHGWNRILGTHRNANHAVTPCAILA